MNIEIFPFNPIQQNTSVVYSGKDAVIIDPGCYDRHEEEELKDIPEKLKKLEEDKKFWMDRIPKGILVLK